MKRIDAKTSLIVVLVAAFAGTGAIAIAEYQSLQEHQKQDAVFAEYIRRTQRDAKEYLCESVEAAECVSLIETYRNKGLREAIEARRFIWQARNSSPRR